MAKTVWSSKDNPSTEWSLDKNTYKILTENGFNILLEDDSGVLLREKEFVESEWLSKTEVNTAWSSKADI